jgi:hypothetical protein
MRLIDSVLALAMFGLSAAFWGGLGMLLAGWPCAVVVFICALLLGLFCWSLCIGGHWQ